MAPRPAATVMLVRDAPTLRVFMLRRTSRASFVAGHHVFPGGGVDVEDASPALFERCRGLDDARASAVIGVPEGGLAYWVAGVRESFEEAGVLLASDPSGAALDASPEAMGPRLHEARTALQTGTRSFLDIVIDLDLRLDVGALVPFSRWITPRKAPRRFDTWFFLAPAPDGHTYRHDDGETVASEWVDPAAAADRAERGELTVILPTALTLEGLSRFSHSAPLLAAARENVANANGPGLGVELPADVPRSMFEPMEAARDEGVA